MAHAIAHGTRTAGSRARAGTPLPRGDALDPMRGILVGALLSLAGFWLPLAFVLTH